MGDIHPAVTPAAPTKVSAVTQTDSSMSFHVSRVGTPVLVKVSYFPNWQASGADGPWRVTPNLMVVVPTSHDVTLSYGATAANDLGLVATLVGVGGSGRAVRRALVPAAEAPGEGLSRLVCSKTWSRAVARGVSRPQAEGDGLLRQCPLVDTMDRKCLICTVR